MTDKPSTAPDSTSAREALRVFNKYVTNRLMRPVAGRKYWYASLIQHIGRRTGTKYATPIVAEPTANGFIIPLPYGTRVDWLRNLQHTGTSTLTRRGRTYAVGTPRIIDAAAAQTLLTPRRQRQFRRFHIDNFVTVELARTDS
ncbi:PNPOx family protein [Nocardia aurantiaca]|uniref:Nitroreductase n=1 Tax=Nocardia aurantiaca TaxID=2675850 RepID=A0A6I3L3I5_9NOCA|nr:nitroreductase [Nocardia aurantiaca]MTE15858.1 nitroreductase [Nocardia aurantiaca]